MKTFLLVKLSLIPAIVFWTLLGQGHPLLALDLGAALGLIFVLWNWRQKRARPMETALFVFMAVTGLALHCGLHIPGDLARELAAASFVVQGVVGFATCALGRPWTASYAAGEYSAMRITPVFYIINMALSLLWSAIFLALAVIAYLHLPGIWSFLQTAIGAIVSIFLPKLMVHFMLARTIRDRETFHWTQPDFSPDRTSGDDHYDVAIIGAGAGGLTAAALLAQSGLKVVVAEQHVVPGGFCHSWLRKQRVNGVARLFRFDSGVHDFSGVYPGGTITEILARLGADVSWARMRHSIALNGRRVAIPDDWRDFVALLAAEFPASAAGLRSFFDEMKAIHDSMMGLGAGHCGVPIQPQTPDALMDFARKNPLAVHWMGKPFKTFIEGHISDEAAQKPLYHLAGYVTDQPDELSVGSIAPIFGYYFHGGFYPEGGSGRFSDALAEAVTRFGGTVLLKTCVKRILVEKGAACGVELASGRKIFARAIISNADLKRTIGDLLPADATPSGFHEKIARAEPATSAFMVHLGLDGAGKAALAALPPIGHILGGDVLGGHILGDNVLGGDGFHIGFVAPSLVDPAAAPEGFATLELISLIPYEQTKNWFADPAATDDAARRASTAYEQAKKAYGDAMIAALETVLPGISQSIVLRVDASPLTFARYDWSSAGAIYGLAKGDRMMGVKGPIPGLWLAGAGNQGPGVQAVMIAAARVAEALKPGLLAGIKPFDETHEPSGLLIPDKMRCETRAV